MFRLLLHMPVMNMDSPNHNSSFTLFTLAVDTFMPEMHLKKCGLLTVHVDHLQKVNSKVHSKN